MTKTPIRFRSRLSANIYESATDLHAAGIVSDTTMREIASLLIRPIEPMTGAEIKAVRAANNVSQPVFVTLLNVSPATVKAWEQGLKAPSGAALKLLSIVKKKGIAAVA